MDEFLLGVANSYYQMEEKCRSKKIDKLGLYM